MSSRLFAVPAGIAYHVVSTLATWFAPLPGGMATAAAIIVFTVAVRLALLPLSYFAVRGEVTRSRLLPRVQELQRKYARQPQRLQRELGALYKTEGAFAGCLPVLLQLPFFAVMYRLFLSRSVAGGPNVLLTHRLLGVPLASRLLSGAGPFSQQGLVFAALLVLLAVAGWFAARTARQMAGGASRTPSRTLSRLLPYGSLFVAAVVPLAAGLYLLTTTTWTVLERTVLWRRLAGSGQAAVGRL